MKTEKEILERIEHIKTLGKGYGINERRIKELEWVLKPSRVKNNVDLNNVVGNELELFCGYCGNKKEHEIPTDANTKLVCRYFICKTK